MTYACPALQFAVETHRWKLQRLQKKVLPTFGQFSRRTPVLELHLAFSVPYVDSYTTELCRHQAEVVHDHENKNVRNKAKPDAENIRSLNLALNDR
jgi:hypothetical protein